MQTFSFSFTPELSKAIIKNCGDKPFDMILRNREEIQAIISAVNQGIDSHLEACFVPDRGDKYIQTNCHLSCIISSESLAVLIRRLMESGEEPAMELASTICAVLDIEINLDF